MKPNILPTALLTLLGAFASSACLAASPAPSADKTLTEFSQPQIIKVAEKREFLGNIADDSSAMMSARSLDASDRTRIKIHRPGASFIKVHFSDFKIPDGSRVIVRSPKGDQRYVYANGNDTPRTLDTEAGDDGLRAFGAMSIEGDTAVVVYRPNAKNDPYSLSIDYIMEGYSQELMEAALSQSAVPGDGGVVAFSTCGANERRDVQCWANSHPTEFERSRPVARLLINGSGLCTAWRVGDGNRMFTNNHCFDSQSEVQNTEVWFNYQRSNCGSGNTGGTVKVTGANLLKTDFTLDYSLFEVNNFSQIQQFGNFGLDVRNASRGERIYIPQHGSGNPKELAIESDQNSGGLCKVDDDFTDGYGTDTDIGYYCDTIGGSSGSPVLAASSNKVIALHHFGGCLNKGVRIAAIWPQVSQFFNGVPNGDNNGGGGGGGGVEPRSGSIPGLANSQGQWTHYTLNVLPGTENMRFALSGGSGDADLYVRRGARPTLNDYQCRPWKNGNNENCEFNNPAAQTWYISIHAYRNFSGVTLNWSYR